MSARRLRARLPAAVGAAVLLLSASPLSAAAAAPAARLRAGSVTVRVDDVSATTLNPTSKLKPFTVTLTVTNETAQELKGVTIEGERGEPIATQAALDKALAHVTPPSGLVVPIKPTTPLRLDLPPGVDQQVTFQTTNSLSVDAGLCTCHKAALYPLFFTAHVQAPGQVDQRIGLAGTFVSSYFQPPAPVRVSWVWPLIDQPHLLSGVARNAAGPVFTDDILAGSVGSGGRLDRALSVVEQAGPDVPLTLVVDPELLYELQLMAAGPYQVQAGSGKTIPGVGSEVAAAWLSRLRSVLSSDPGVRIQLTPYADPEVESLSQAGFHWSTELPAAMQKAVDTALGEAVTAHTLTWPAGGALSGKTLDQLVSAGTNTVLLNSSAVTLNPRPAPDAVLPGLTRLSSHGRDVAVGLMNAALQRYLGQVITVGGAGAAAIPQLQAELSVRATQEPEAAHVAVLVAPRWVDPSVDVAVRLLRQTSRSTFTRPISLAAATEGTLLPNGHSRLAAVPPAASTLPQANLDAVAQLSSDLPALRSLLTPAKPQTIDPQAEALLAGLPRAGQRVSSSAWGRTGNVDGGRFAHALTGQLDSLTHGVTIVKPSGSYTLASDNSPLPLTVENSLDFPVTVTVQVSTVNGLPGFTSKPAKEVVEAHEKRTLHLATNVDRSGRIRVEASLLTPDGLHPLGDPVQMTVRSTALGVVGVVITIVAGVVLALALLIRFGRRLRHRRRRGGRPARPHWDPDLPTAGAGVGDTVPASSAERSR